MLWAVDLLAEALPAQQPSGAQATLLAVQAALEDDTEWCSVSMSVPISVGMPVPVSVASLSGTRSGTQWHSVALGGPVLNGGAQHFSTHLQ